MSDVNAQIKIAVDAAQAQAELKALQAQITALNASMASQRKAKGFDLGMGNAAGQITQIQTAATNLNRDLQKMSRGFGSSLGTLKNSIKGVGPEMALARKNAAALGTQYVMLGQQANGAMAAFKGGQLAGFNSELAVMQQRVAIGIQGLNQMGTAALNWGKNIQWAGRQLMVGLTIPFTIFAGVAIKAFKDVETEIINLKKVYGDFGTSDEEVERVTAAVKDLSREMSVLGFSAKETIAVAADAAAIGFVGNDLLEFTKQASEFASLGMMTQTEALNSLVAVNSAFKTEVADLKNEVNFLNAVENQTILSMQDMAEAIPITAAAIQGLGGDIKDLAVFMTAMREGGINANESANALKTSLARLITPTRQALETANEFGIALESIVANNEGDLMGMVQSLAGAMESLSDLQQQQLLSDLFGKRQFARMGALFNNLNREGSQAQKTIELTTMSMEDLAQVRDKELGALKESPAMQLSKQLENIQLALAPIGEIFTELLVDILGPLETVLNWFNSLEDGFKKIVAVGGAVVAVLIPAITMFVGLMGNLAGTMMNVIATLARWATGTSSFTTEQAEMAAQANAAAVAENGLTNSLQQQAIALEALIAQYNRLNTARMPGGGAAPPLRMATGGRVPGAGNTDKIPALLTPGEFVVNKKQSQKNAGFLHALNNGSVKGFSGGGGTGNTELTHTRSGGSIVISTDDAEADAKLQKRLDARRKALQKEHEQIEKNVELQSEADRRHLAAIDKELSDLEAIEKGWQDIKTEAEAGGYVGNMKLESSGVAGVASSFNQKIKSTGLGATAQETSAAFRGTDAYANIAAQEAYFNPDITQQEEKDLVQASRDLSNAVADRADTIEKGTVVVDDAQNTAATGKVVELGQLEVEAAEKLVAEKQAQVDYLSNLEDPTDLDRKALALAKRELAAREKLVARLEKSHEQVGEARSGLSYDPEVERRAAAGDAKAMRQMEHRRTSAEAGLEEQKRQRAEKNKARIARGDAPKTTPHKHAIMGQDGKLHFPSKNQRAAATKRARGSKVTGYYGAIEKDAQAMLKRANMDADAYEDTLRARLEDLKNDPYYIATSTSRQSPHPDAPKDGADDARAYTSAMEAVLNGQDPYDQVTDDIAQGVRQGAQEPVKAVAQVGEQMELQFDESFDGHRVGQDAMQETGQGVRSGGTGTGKKPDATGLPGQNKKRMQGSQMAQMGIGMGVSALSTLPMMTGQDNIMGVSSEFTMGVGMATGQIAAFASMLPVGGAAVAGLAAAAGVAAFAIEALKAKAEKAAEEAYELGKNLGGAADSAQKMSDVFGKATATQKRSRIKFAEDEEELANEFAAALGSEGGKALVEELSLLTGQERTDQTAQYIETAIVNGMIEADQASTFAKALGNEIGDTGLAGRIALELSKSEGKTRTERAESIAEKRDRAIKEDGTINRAGTPNATAKTMGASLQALQDWTTVASVARDEYANGVIGYQEYIRVLNEATEAQGTYSDMLRNSINLGANGGVGSEFSNQKSIMSNMGSLGIIGDEQQKYIDAIQAGRVEQFDKEGLYVFTDGLSKWMSEAGEAMGIGTATDEGEINAQQLTSAVNEDTLMFQAIAAQLGNVDEALALTLQMQDETSDAYAVYNKVLQNTTDETAALEATIATLNMSGNANFNQPGIQDAFSRGVEGKSNTDLYSNLIQDGQTKEQMATQLKYGSGDVSYISGGENGPAGERVVDVESGFKGKNADMFADQYANAMGSVAETIGPEMQDKLAPHVALAIMQGMEDGGTEGITQLESILGDQEAVNMYIDFALEDGKLEAGELKEIAEQLAYIKAEIPPDMRLLFGIELENPEHFEKLSDPAVVDQLQLVGKTIEGLPEEERKLAAMFAFDIEENGEPKSPKQFIKGWKQVQKDIGTLEGQDLETKRTTLIDIITQINGAQTDPASVNNAVDSLIGTYGAGTVANLPPTVLTTAVNILVEADEAIANLQAVASAKALGGIDNSKELEMIKELQKTTDAQVADIVTPAAFNAPSDSGGGGGGGGDKSWLDTLEEDYKKSNKVADNLKELAKYNNKQAKEVNKLNEETMQYLAEDEKAMKQFRSGKYSAKEINKMYFSNMKKGEKQQTKEMRTQNRREDLVDNSGLDYFTKEQIKADAELLEMYEKGGKARDFAIAQATERALQETTILDRYERQVQLQQQLRDYESERLDVAIQRAEYEAENAFFADKGTDRAAVDQRQAEIAADIKVITMEQIDPIKEKIEEEKRLIKELEREYEVNEDNIDVLKDQVDERKRIVEDMQRALELRQREGEMLSHDLKLMGYIEEDINEAYDKRVEALEKTASLNQQIAQSQQDQLGLADALSRGDLGAAAAAAQQMQQNQMQFASEQYRNQLEVNKENAINNLTGAESGMTKDQITERQRELEEDSYQTNLKIRAVEDEIYNLNRQIRDEQDIIAGYKDKIETHNKKIRDYEWDIYDAEQQYLVELQKEQTANNLLLAQADKKQTFAGNSLKIQKARWDRESAIISAEQNLNILGLQIYEEQGKAIDSNTESMVEFGKAAAAAYKAIQRGEFKYEGKKKGRKYKEAQSAAIKALNDRLQGELKNFANVNSILENTVDLDKVAIPNMATASYNVPASAVGSSAVSGIMGTVTNNYNTNNVNVSSVTPSSADDIANLVMQKINFAQMGNVR